MRKVQINKRAIQSLKGRYEVADVDRSCSDGMGCDCAVLLELEGHFTVGDCVA